MAKKECSICGSSQSWLFREKILDGYICSTCTEKAGFNRDMRVSAMSYTTEHIKRIINGELPPHSPISYRWGDTIVYFNIDSNTWTTNSRLSRPAHHLDDVISYEYIENDKGYSVTKTIGTSVIGGLAFGGIGALIGGIIGNNQQPKIKKAEIVVTIQTTSIKDWVTIPLVTKHNSPIIVNSAEYTKLHNIVKSICSHFDKAIGVDISPSSNDTQTTKADEIRQLKSLLDNGIISADDFEKGKNIILRG